MKFLIEKSLITPEQEELYKSLNNNKKTKFIQDLLKNHPNYNNIKDALTLYSDAIYDYGFDDTDNPFIKFMSKVKQDLPYEIVSLIWTLNKNNKLDMDKAIRYLTMPSLYKGDTKEVLNKVKALAYSLNDDLQQNASRKITPELLMDKGGKFLSYPEMEKVLNRITIAKDDLTVQNAINKLYGYKNLSNKNNEVQIKNRFKKLIQEHKSFNEDMLDIIDKTPIETLVRIPISNTTEKGLQVGLINFLTGKSSIFTRKSNKKGSNIDIKSISSKINKSEKEVENTIDKSIQDVDDAEAIVKEEALSVLTNLGVTKTEALKAINDLYTDGITLDKLINNYFTGVK